MQFRCQEVKARGARVIGVVTEGDHEASRLCDRVFPVPEAAAALEPILAALPLQALDDEVGRVLGRNLEKPRDLAKSVTVD